MVLGNGPGLAGGLGHGDGGDLRPPADHDLAVAALGQDPDRGRPEAGGQDPVERGRHAAALEVAEDDHPGVLAGHLGDLGGHMGADPAQGAGRLLVELAAAPLLGAFGADHDREVGAAVLAGQDLGGDRLDGEGDLREEDDVGPAAQARVEGDPAGVAAHHLQHHHPVVAGRGGVQPVKGLGGHGQGGVEAEGAVAAPEVVVDRLGHPDRPDPVAGQLAGDPLAALAADHDQGVDPEPLGVGGQLLVGGRVADPLAVDLHGREVPLVGGAEDGPAPVQQPADRRAVEGPGAGAADQPLVALLDAEHGPAVVDLGRPDHRADDRVQPWCVATAGEHPDASDWRRHVGCTPSCRWVSTAP